jgi:hypothetical protein
MARFCVGIYLDRRLPKKNKKKKEENPKFQIEEYIPFRTLKFYI